MAARRCARPRHRRGAQRRRAARRNLDPRRDLGDLAAAAALDMVPAGDAPRGRRPAACRARPGARRARARRRGSAEADLAAAGPRRDDAALSAAADHDDAAGRGRGHGLRPPRPRRSIVAILPWVVHRHRKLWHDPDRFDPERFSPAAVAARSRYAYLPFAVGPHVCVGASMAMLQLTVAVAVLARQFRFRLVPRHPVEPTAWTDIRPRDGMWMTGRAARTAASTRAA